MSQSLITSLQSVTEKLSQIVTKLSANDYAEPHELLSGNTIGKHTRHIIEFLEALYNGLPKGEVDYDLRERNILYETNATIATERLAELITLLTSELSRENKPILLVYQLHDRQKNSLLSSLERELLYNLDHIVHHQAILQIILKNNGKSHLLDANFGLAFATQQQQNYQKN